MQYDTSEMKTLTVDMGSDPTYVNNHDTRKDTNRGYIVHIPNTSAEMSRVKKIALVSCTIPNMLPNLRIKDTTVALEEYTWGTASPAQTDATAVNDLYFTSSEPNRHTNAAYTGAAFNLTHGGSNIIPQNIHVTSTQLLAALNDTDAFRSRTLNATYDSVTDRFFWQFTDTANATLYMNNIATATTKELRLTVRYKGKNVNDLKRLNFFQLLGYENTLMSFPGYEKKEGWHYEPSTGDYVQSLLLNGNTQRDLGVGANQDIIDSGHALDINQWHKTPSLQPPNFVGDSVVHVAIDRMFTGKRIVPSGTNASQYEVAATVPLTNVPHGGFATFHAPDHHLHDIDFLDRSGRGQSLSSAVRVRLLSSNYSEITEWPSNYPISLVIKVFADRQDVA